MTEYAVVGRRLPKLDAVAKTTGETVYLGDMKLPGMLHGKVLRSPLPHARIARLDTAAAARLPGVRAVITAADTPRVKFSFVEALADKYLLCTDRVRFIGDEVAAVAAIDEATALQALDLIEVEYDELPCVFDPEAAMQPEAARLHNGASNVAWEVHQEFGDLERGFAEADEVFEDRYETSRVCHCCLETQAVIAQAHQGGRLEVWAATQAPHTLKHELDRLLQLPPGSVRVHYPPIGGSFGNRLVADMKAPIAAILSRQTGKPVKIVNSRTEEFETARTRYPYLVTMKTGVRRDGRIVARAARVICDNGAYNDKGPSTVASAGVTFAAFYNVPNVRYDGYIVYTNKQPGTGFRGFGNPQVTFAGESQLDMIAERLGLDPLELRLRNANRAGEAAASGARPGTCPMAECLRQAAAKIGWQRRRELPPNRGLGLAAMLHTGAGARMYGYNSASAGLTVDEEGKVTLVSSVTDVGQGAQTVMAQIAAEVLGIGLDEVRVIGNDTDLTAYDLGAWGSRTTWVNGQAAREAALRARERLAQSVAAWLEAAPEDLEFQGGKIFVRGAPDRGLDFAQAARLTYTKRGEPISETGRFVDELGPTMKGWGDVYPTFSTACQAVEVEVDPETGAVRVLQAVAVHDIGQAINPMAAEGQVEGALAQGIGYALMEELLLDGGRAVNPTFADYKIPTFIDVPDPQVVLYSDPDPTGPFGAKGIGEPGLVPTAPAIANAIYHATGARLRSLPITSERLFTAMREQPAAPGPRRAAETPEPPGGASPDQRADGSGPDKLQR
ncbi:MAG: molybdopterin-dependent oxidoreductase [Candidatus Tectomicrobia bacterium]|nr:molybdopterin-dependent oxidoreductase [Candidatus Tectomicrobia bacterium]